MSGERRLEYDKGPSLEQDEPAGDADDRGSDEDGENRDDPASAGRRVVICPSWMAGLVSGAGAFAAVFAVTYQLARAMTAAGSFSGAENDPSQWAITGITMLGSHGGSIEEGGEPIDVFVPQGFFTSHVSALVPVVVLAIAGYLLVRHVRLETRVDGAVAFGAMALSYVVLAVALARVATWSPQESVTGTGDDAAVIAVATDASLVVSTGVTVLVFATLGAAIAAIPRLLEYAPLETVETEPAE